MSPVGKGRRANAQNGVAARNHFALSTVVTLRRIKILLFIAFTAIAQSTWRLVRLAHSTLPDHELKPHHTRQIPRPLSSAGRVPYLPPLPKVNPIPRQALVKSWMMHPGNETAGQFLLDFAIIGNAKCGTSTIMNWLYEHSQIQIPRDELYHLKSKEAWDLVGVFYDYFGGPQELLPQSIKGYKSPSDITNERAIRMLRAYFPHTKLLIGLRHPVFMLESFYNFRIQNGYSLPPLEKLHYRNLANQYAVSFSRADYHTSLMYLGKTNLTAPEELALMPAPAQKQIQKQLDKRNNLTEIDGHRNSNNLLLPPFVQVPNPVFLYDTAQLSAKDNHPALLHEFGQDIANYLGLSAALPPPPRHSPGKRLLNATLQAERDAKKIHICEDRYMEQRKQLLHIGERAAKWILDYFLPSENVYVSNPEHFRDILRGYSQDPCHKKD